MNETSKKVFRNYLIISGLYTLSASLIWGVNTLFLLDAGLNIQEVFIANAAFTAGMALFEIPTGVVADTVGRRASFLLSVIVLFFGTWGYYAVAKNNGNLAMFVIVSVFMGLGFTFYSGAVEAWLVDALKFTGFEGSLDKVFARGSMVSGGAMLIGTVGGGFLGTIDLGLPYIIRAVLLAAVFIVAFFSMYDLGYQPRSLSLATLPSEMNSTLRASIQHGWAKQPVRLLMIVYFIQSAFFTWAFYAWQPYFLDLLRQPDAIWIAGIVSALVALAMIIGNSLVERFARYCARRTTLLIWAAVVQSIAAILLGLSGSFWLALVMLLIMMGATGVTQPVAQAYIHSLIPSEERATIISFNSMIGSAGSILGQSGLGRISFQRSIPAGYVVGGLFTLLALPVLYRLRRLENEVDPIDGEVGTKSLAAAQGLPNICAVDTGATLI